MPVRRAHDRSFNSGVTAVAGFHCAWTFPTKGSTSMSEDSGVFVVDSGDLHWTDSYAVGNSNVLSEGKGT